MLSLAGGAIVVGALIERAVQAAGCGFSGLLLGVGIAVAGRQGRRGGFVMPAGATEERQWVITEGGSSTRPPGPPAADRRWPRSYWPGAAVVAVGLALILPAGSGTNVLGQFVAVLGACLLANAVAGRRGTGREPRRWTIDDDGLRSGNRLGSVHWTWTQVHRVVEPPDVYLPYQEDGPHTAAFDVPRDTLTPDQDGELRAFLAGRGLVT